MWVYVYPVSVFHQPGILSLFSRCSAANWLDGPNDFPLSDLTEKDCPGFSRRIPNKPRVHNSFRAAAEPPGCSAMEECRRCAPREYHALFTYNVCTWHLLYFFQFF
ncbi:hypothetical protein CEXT_206311 [Caerostris extrusa]|uniref:Secreted protein n=1 Tax=Caerostris extrusa TaxID=172846 RepID=A0AAV4QQ30_CAEEX|nr:hypothetical protein CEXT_206311 [Caerostris extrusa]